MRALLGLTLVALTASCSAKPSGTLRLVTGAETDTFTRNPPPATLRVDAIDSSNQEQTLASVSLPATTIDLGTMDEAAIETLRVSGLAANGSRVVFGQSIPIQLGALDGLTLPLFVQRTGELARMPGPLSDARGAPVLALMGGRFLFVGAGQDDTLAKTTQLYDFAQFAPLGSPPALPRVPESVAFVGTVAWLIDAAGASQFDFSTSGAIVNVTLPDGGTGGAYADIAGGSTVIATDGTQYIVGATRQTPPPTAAVFAIDPNGNVSWQTLSAPRQGASAVWVDGHGLVVLGGSSTAAGVEVIANGAMTGAPLAYPPDSSTGSGAAKLDNGHVLLAGGVASGGDAGVRAIDLACPAACAPTTWSDLPSALASAQAFAMDSANAVVVGDDMLSGQTHVYRLTTAGATELITKVTRAHARAIASPVGPPGSFLLAGGAPVIEAFAP